MNPDHSQTIKDAYPFYLALSKEAIGAGVSPSKCVVTGRKAGEADSQTTLTDRLTD